jgi:hypothetical protein
VSPSVFEEYDAVESRVVAQTVYEALRVLLATGGVSLFDSEPQGEGVGAHLAPHRLLQTRFALAQHRQTRGGHHQPDAEAQQQE